MRKVTFVLFGIAVALTIGALLAPGAEAATPRKPDKPKLPETSRRNEEPEPVVKPAVRGGLLSLGRITVTPTKAVEPDPVDEGRDERVSVSATSERSRAPRRTEAPRSGSVGKRVAEAWPGDEGKALRVVDCESEFNPGARSASGRYRGLWQFDTQTWRSVGGRGSPEDASIEEQTRRAWRLRQSRGWQPWPVCGRR